MASAQQHIEKVRVTTSYAALRQLIQPIYLLGMALAVISALGTLRAGFAAMKFSFFSGVGIWIVGLASSALGFYIAQFFKEAATMAADVADSITDANARADAGPGSGT